jgi:putative DNA-invertase from lambdoid prophage Rac
MNCFALYLRVSTLDQTNENQKVRLIEYAKQKGFEFEIFEEIESSRRTRPVKQVLLQKLRNGEYAGVIVHKIDRWARSSTELILEIKELVDNYNEEQKCYHQTKHFDPTVFFFPAINSCRG